MLTVIVIESKVKSVVIFYATEREKKKTFSYVTQEREISIEHVHVMSHRYFTTWRRKKNEKIVVAMKIKFLIKNTKKKLSFNVP